MAMRIVSPVTKKNIGWILKERRLKKGLSQAELCDKANITRTFLSLIENGKRTPTYGALARIAGAMGEDPQLLEAEAKETSDDPEVKLANAIKRLSKNKKTLKKLVELIETLG